MGAGLLAVGPKFWVFTLSAIAAIGDAGLGQPWSTLTFLLFVVLAQGLQIAVLVLAFAAPAKSEVVLGQASDWLSAHNRIIVIVLGVVFGLWSLAKGLTGLGVL